MKRFLLISLVVALVAILGGALSVWLYLRSSHVAQQVATRLEAVYGGPVKVGSVDVGISDSAEFGKLLLTGSLDPQAHLAVAKLTTEAKAHVTQALLDRLPFVPASAWQELQIAEGDASAEVGVRYDWQAGSLHYRVDAAA